MNNLTEVADFKGFVCLISFEKQKEVLLADIGDEHYKEYQYIDIL
jgi:hypothetical protein